MVEFKIVRKVVCCTGCDKPNDEVRVLIAMPADAFICNECVRLCSAIVAEREGALSEQQIEAALDWLHQPRQREMTAADLGLEG